MSSARPKQYGVTEPISTQEPTAEELKKTEELVQCLKDEGQFESEQEARKREVVLGTLNTLFKKFVARVSMKQGLDETVARQAGGKIFAFGSYRLGVHGAGADIDTLCVAPSHVRREDFFSDLYQILKNRSDVTELTAVEDAYVPVIKMCFDGIPIDLLFARLNGLSLVPDDLDLSNNQLLRGLDERGIRSLNGSRVTDEILRLVPDVPSFRLVLRGIKLWGKRRAIYSNIMGFLGGVAWAMLVARVCQLYPNATASVILAKFFHIMCHWSWPQPVLLKPIEDGPLPVRVWNPKLYPADRSHRMPIITPAYPSMCATHNVTKSTQLVMTREFERAAEISSKALVGQLPWSALFEKDDFFYRYRYYLQVIASSDSEELQLRWGGLVESKLRQLVLKLEILDDLTLVHPYIKEFGKVCKCSSIEESHLAARGVFPEEEAEGDKVFRTVHCTVFYLGLAINIKSLKNNSKRLDLSWPSSEFIKLAKSWDGYDDSHMGIVIQHMKASDLPPDVRACSVPIVKAKKAAKMKRAPSVNEDDEKSKKQCKEAITRQPADDMWRELDKSESEPNLKISGNAEESTTA